MDWWNKTHQQNSTISTTSYRCIYKDPSTAIQWNSSNQYKEPVQFSLRLSGVMTAIAHVPASVGLASNPKVEHSLLDWIPKYSCFCTIWPNETARNRKDGGVHHCHFVISAYTPTDCSSDKVKDKFYRKLSTLLQKLSA